MSRVANATNIPPIVKLLIIDEALKNRAEPRGTVVARLADEIERIGERVPDRKTMEKMISMACNSDGIEDRPWSVSSLADYTIPPDALTVVLQAWAKALKDNDPLSIRQVRWIARLYFVLKDKDTDWLIEISKLYARQEKALLLIGNHFDKPQDIHWLWLEDRLLYEEVSGDYSLRKIPLEKKD